MPSQTSFPQGRRALTAATCAILLGAAMAVAQTGTAGSPSSSQKHPTSEANASSATASTSTQPANPADANADHSGTAAADVDSTKEINAQNRSTTAAGTMTGRESKGDKLGWMDRRFMHKAADDGHDEINLAKLATERASNPEVRSYAQKLVDDHTKVAEELKGIASQKNVKIEEDNDHDRAYKRMARRSGADFDREFVEHMIDEHEKDIRRFEQAAKDAKDPDVRSFASKHIDHLREHLREAQSLRQSVMPTGRKEQNSGSYGSSGAGTGSGTSATTGTTGTSGDTTTKPNR